VVFWMVLSKQCPVLQIVLCPSGSYGGDGALCLVMAGIEWDGMSTLDGMANGAYAGRLLAWK
jgi:hypothetical protein